jgi:hypothetical protein
MKTQRYKFEKMIEAAPEAAERESVKFWLKSEFKNILESDKHYTRKADYIGLSIADIDEKIKSIDEEIKELQQLKRTLKEAKEIAQEVGAEVFAEYGVDRIEGNAISSITISEGSTKTDVCIIDESKAIAIGFFKKVVDKEALKEALLGADERNRLDGVAELQIIKKPSMLKVNKRRKKTLKKSVGY